MCPAERNPPSPSGGGEKLRWRKESFPWRHHPQDTDRSPQHELEQESQVEDHLAAESNMVILDTLENIVQVHDTVTLIFPQTFCCLGVIVSFIFSPFQYRLLYSRVLHYLKHIMQFILTHLQFTVHNLAYSQTLLSKFFFS